MPRIPLDSKWFQNDELNIGFGERLNALLESEMPTSVAVKELVEDSWLVDYPAEQFHLMTPYLVDLFVRGDQEYIEAITAFCYALCRAFDGQPSHLAVEQLVQNRERINELLIGCLGREQTLENAKYLLAGLSANNGHPELGDQITQIVFQ